MFTIKHIAPNGHEFAMECASYAVEPLEPVNTSDEQRFRLLTFDTPYRQDEYSMMWAGCRSGRYPGAEELHVMNRFGATIASHYFTNDSQQGSYGGTCADPAALAQAA